MKGVNTWSNYKKSKAMTKAVEKLYEAQEIDHRWLTRPEGQTSLLAKTTKTAFQHIDYRLPHLDTKLNYTVQHMTEFFKRTETHFRFTWEALVSNRLAIHLLSSGSAMYDMVLRQYLHYHHHYDVTLDHYHHHYDVTLNHFLTHWGPDDLHSKCWIQMNLTVS